MRTFKVTNVGTRNIGMGQTVPLFVSFQVLPLTPAAERVHLEIGTPTADAGVIGILQPTQSIDVPVTLLGAGDGGEVLEWWLPLPSSDRSALDAGVRIRAVQ